VEDPSRKILCVQQPDRGGLFTPVSVGSQLATILGLSAGQILYTTLSTEMKLWSTRRGCFRAERQWFLCIVSPAIEKSKRNLRASSSECTGSIV
jgi:hypothetical protein